MAATKLRKKPVRLKAIQHFQLTGIVIESEGMKINDIIELAKDKGITTVNANHIRGIAKAHGVTLAAKTRGASPIEKAEKCRVAYIKACDAAGLDNIVFLPSGTVPHKA